MINQFDCFRHKSHHYWRDSTKFQFAFNQMRAKNILAAQMDATFRACATILVRWSEGFECAQLWCADESFPRLVNENTWSFGFFRAHTFALACVHDTSNLSKLQMKKEKSANLNRKPKLKLVNFDDHSSVNDVTEEQKQNCHVNLCFSKNSKRFMHGHHVQNQSQNWSRASFSRMSFDHAA